MKQIIAFFIAFCFSYPAIGQVQKLGELSSGSFLDSYVIMEEDESDVYGYCLLYETNRKSKEVFDLEYIILDKNLNKLTSISLTQAVFKIWTARTRAELTFVKKIGNQLIIGVNDRIVKASATDMKPFFNYRFINLNLDNFTFSNEYKYEDFTKKEQRYESGDKVEFNDFWYLQKLVKTKTNYLLSFASPEYNPKIAMVRSMLIFNYKQHKSVKSFSILDKDLNKIWSKDINQNKKTACRYEYLDSDKEILMLKKETLYNKVTYESKAFEVYNMQNGNLLGEVKLEDDTYDINLYSVKITDNKIHVFTNAYDKKGKSRGHLHITYDKQNLSELNRNYILWANLNSVIPGVDDKGKLGKEGYMLTQDFILTPKGNTLMTAELFITKSSGYMGNPQKAFAQLKDMYLIEFNPEGDIVYSKKIEKSNSVAIPSGLTGIELKNYGAFDYIYSQKLNENGDFVMFYTLNDQEGNKRKVAKKPLWTLGIIANVDGEYSFETLPLYGDNLKIYPGLAKNGYIKLLEVNLKTYQAEMRLERINY